MLYLYRFASLVLLALTYASVYGERYLSLSNCEDAYVEVSSISILCDSPYTFYYGNGAHRKSLYCDYGDKATITMNFNVTSSLADGSSIYMTLGIYAAQSRSELLYSLRAAELCKNFVGYSCTSQGGYSFSFQANFDYLYGNSSDFMPIYEVGFSSQKDEGYNLGGVNINCGYNEDEEDVDEHDAWITSNTAKVKTRGSGSFAANYGIFLGVVAMLVGFVGFIWKESEETAVEIRSNPQLELLGINERLRPID